MPTTNNVLIASAMYKVVFSFLGNYLAKCMSYHYYPTATS